jgi:hypothetical protein
MIPTLSEPAPLADFATLGPAGRSPSRSPTNDKLSDFVVALPQGRLSRNHHRSGVGAQCGQHGRPAKPLSLRASRSTVRAMPTQNVIVIYAAPIPVGHRVDIRWYRRVSSGLLGGTKEERRDPEPVIVDLDTGIEYASDFALRSPDGGVKYPDRPIEVLDAPDKDAQLFARLLGRVMACRVVHVRGFSDLDVQTHLVVEADPAGGPPYRGASG